MQRNNKNQKNTPGTRSRARAGTPFPPQLQATLQIDKVVRFKASAALSDVTIAAANMLNVLAMALTATTSARLPQTVKLRKLEAWAPPSTDGTPVVLSVEDVAAGLGFSNSSRRVEDVTMGQNRPAHIVWKPSPLSLASKWLDLNGSSIFRLNGPSGTTVDVHLSWVLQDGETPVSAGALVGATAGQLYMRALDASGSGLLVPVSYVTL